MGEEARDEHERNRRTRETPIRKLPRYSSHCLEEDTGKRLEKVHFQRAHFKRKRKKEEQKKSTAAL